MVNLLLKAAPGLPLLSKTVPATVTDADSFPFRGTKEKNSLGACRALVSNGPFVGMLR